MEYDLVITLQRIETKLNVILTDLGRNAETFEPMQKEEPVKLENEVFEAESREELIKKSEQIQKALNQKSRNEGIERI